MHASFARRLYVISSSPNPQLSPELQAKATVVDFTVTMQGLEDQLLSQVVQSEQRSLEDQLRAVYTDITANTKALSGLNDTLLKRLAQSQGNLLDDTTLMTVLAGENLRYKVLPLVYYGGIMLFKCRDVNALIDNTRVVRLVIVCPS